MEQALIGTVRVLVDVARSFESGGPTRLPDMFAQKLITARVDNVHRYRRLFDAHSHTQLASLSSSATHICLRANSSIKRPQALYEITILRHAATPASLMSWLN